MKKEEYEKYLAMPEHELMDYVTETQGSQRGHASRFILQARLASKLDDVAKSSARAAWAAAIAAGISVLVTLAQILR